MCVYLMINALVGKLFYMIVIQFTTEIEYVMITKIAK